MGIINFAGQRLGLKSTDFGFETSSETFQLRIIRLLSPFHFPLLGVIRAATPERNHLKKQMSGGIDQWIEPRSIVFQRRLLRNVDSRTRALAAGRYGNSPDGRRQVSGRIHAFKNCLVIICWLHELLLDGPKLQLNPWKYSGNMYGEST